MVKDLRNRLDFFFRRRLKWGRDLPDDFIPSETDQKLQSEMREFLGLFPWPKLLSGMPRKIIALDVGARNFATASVMEECFTRQGHLAELHGIEIDAYRRLRDFRTRKDYGDFFARRAKNARYHAIDFCEWRESCDFIFLLNPFVSEGPLLSWGLPLNELKPRSIFEHAAHLLSARKGKLLLSCPSSDELELAKGHADAVGFVPELTADWEPGTGALQDLPRHGIVFKPSAK